MLLQNLGIGTDCKYGILKANVNHNGFFSQKLGQLPGYCLMNPAELPKYCQESVGSRL